MYDTINHRENFTFITNIFLTLYCAPVKPWSFMKTLLWYFKQWKASTAAQHMGNRIYVIHVDLVCHFKTSIHSLYKKSPLMPMDLCLFIMWFQNYSLSESKCYFFDEWQLNIIFKIIVQQRFWFCGIFFKSATQPTQGSVS